MSKPECKLVGTDGNAFAIIGKVSCTLKRNDMDKEAKEFTSKTLKCESYNELLQLAMKYVDVI